MPARYLNTLRNLTFATLFLLANGDLFAQHSRTYNDVFPSYGDYHRRGWVFSPSLNYTLPGLKKPNERLWITGDSVYDVAYDPGGRLGVGLEFGRFHIIDRSRLISHIELNMGIKILHGIERFEATLDEAGRENPYTIYGEGTFSHTYATMSFTASNIQQFSRTSFLQNSIGINGDYRVMANMNYDRQGMPINLQNPTRFIFQAHYRLGFGFKMARNLIVVPSIETPLITFYEYDDLKSTLAVFNSRFRPFILRLNILLMDKKAGRKCPSNKPKRKLSETLFGSNSAQPW